MASLKELLNTEPILNEDSFKDYEKETKSRRWQDFQSSIPETTRKGENCSFCLSDYYYRPIAEINDIINKKKIKQITLNEITEQRVMIESPLIQSQFTRPKKECNPITEVDYNRFQYLFKQPNHVENWSRGGLPSRQQGRDRYASIE
jgi:uncharacterized protein YnzC (UPF0291/DUF896 family)